MAQKAQKWFSRGKVVSKNLSGSERFGKVRKKTERLGKTVKDFTEANEGNKDDFLPPGTPGKKANSAVPPVPNQ